MTEKTTKYTGIFMIFFLIFPCFTSAEESAQKTREDFFITPVFEISLYSIEDITYGGGIVLGYGKGTAIGLKIIYFYNNDGFNILELCFLVRFYFFGRNAYSGPYIQLLGGTVLFNYINDFTIPSQAGSFSAGAGIGWRFLFRNRWYIEPVVRGGYPYIFGAGISAGIRF